MCYQLIERTGHNESKQEAAVFPPPIAFQCVRPHTVMTFQVATHRHPVTLNNKTEFALTSITTKHFQGSVKCKCPTPRSPSKPLFLSSSRTQTLGREVSYLLSIFPTSQFSLIFSKSRQGAKAERKEQGTLVQIVLLVLRIEHIRCQC